MSGPLLPAGAFLAWRYHDRRQGVHRGRVYWEDGRIDSIEGDDRTEVCRLDAGQLMQAQAAVSALGSGRDDGPGEDPAHDTAGVVYAWRVGGSEGRLAYQYPPEPQAVAMLEARLSELEEAAGCWPLLAEE